MFGAAANGLDGRPHVFGRVQQIPARHFELVGINPAAVIDTLRSPRGDLLKPGPKLGLRLRESRSRPPPRSKASSG